MFVKTAISIPDSIFESAEKLAQRLGKSRSELYTQAINSYLEKNSEVSIKKLLDKVYVDVDSQLDPAINNMQARSVPREKW